MRNPAIRRFVVALAYLAVIAVNGLANALPLNGVQTGEVSANLPNLFTPATYAFAIWGLIYLLLAGYMLYGFIIHEDDERRNREAHARLAVWFVASSATNIGWIFAWHFGAIALSTLLMALFTLFLARARLVIADMTLRGREKLLVRLPFSVYFGWVTVATIASAAASLVHLGYLGAPFSQAFWTVLALLVGTAVGGAVMLRFVDNAYGLVFLWAYGAILVRHVSVAGYGGRHPSVIAACVVCLALLVLAQVLVVRRRGALIA